MTDRPTDRPTDVVVPDNDRPATDHSKPWLATNHDPTEPAPLPIEDAAAVLGISVNAVRQRLKRGTLRGHKTPAGWVVVVSTDQATTRGDGRRPTDQPPSATRPMTNQPADQPAIAPLADLIADLSRENRELAAAAALWQERARSLGERLQALEAGPIATSHAGDVARDAPQDAMYGPRPSDALGEVAEIPPWRRWLRRLSGTP